MKTNLDFVYSPKLLFTPRLKQMIKILEMSPQELFDYAAEQIEQNPVLEYGTRGNRYFDSGCFSVSGQYYTPAGVTLKEYLIFQLHISESDRVTNSIGEYLIDSVDENGYVTVTTSDVSEYFNVPKKKVLSALRVLQAFDPPGVCARNLQECLVIQLRQMNSIDSSTIRIIESHLDDIARNTPEKAAAQEDISIQRARDIFNLIRKLDPTPGRRFYDNGKLNYMVPDLIVKKAGQETRCAVNRKALPSVKIGKYYRELARSNLCRITRKYICDRINSGKWFIKCMLLRRRTLERLGIYILKAEKGIAVSKNCIGGLDPDRAASSLDISEYTFTRLVRNKNIQCPWGTVKITQLFRM